MKVNVLSVLSQGNLAVESLIKGGEKWEFLTVDNWDVKRVYSLHTLVSGKLNFKINKRFDSLSWSLVVRYLYTRRANIIGEIKLLVK